VAGPAVPGRNLLIVERDDARAGKLIMAFRELGAKAVRWSDDERGRTQARALKPDAVLVDAALADGWAEPALRAIAADPGLGAPDVIRTDAARVWAVEEPVQEVLAELARSVPPRHERETKSLRAVAAPGPVAPPKIGLPPAGARKVASSRATAKMGSVDAAGVPVPALPDEPETDPEPTPEPSPPPEESRKQASARFAKEKPRAEGYVFPTRGSEVELESSSKATSIDLTVVPSSLLERANLPDTDRLPRVPDPPRWPWILLAAVLSVIGIGLAYLSH
jgi:hypothetical protein